MELNLLSRNEEALSVSNGTVHNKNAIHLQEATIQRKFLFALFSKMLDHCG